MAAQPNAIELTKQIVRMNTINPPGQEEQCARHLGGLLENAGFRIKYHELSPQRASLVATIGGSADKAPLCFTGHIDTVPLGAAQWKMDPFAADTEGGKLYGRGTSDMKCGVAAFVVASLNLASRLEHSPGLELVITAAEETGCEGAFAMASSPEVRELLGTAGALVVAEPTGNLPLLGHKGAFWVAAQAAGTTAHGSMPERGDNAVYKIARAALALEKFEFETGAHALMGSPTLNVGTARGGLNINSVPDAAELGIDIRTVAGQDHAQVLRCLCRVLGPQISLRTLLDVNSVYTVPEDAWMRRVFAICKARSGLEQEHRTVSYFTDAAALRAPLGMPPVVILGPGEPDLAHQTDEYCRVDRIGEATVLFADLIDDWLDSKA